MTEIILLLLALQFVLLGWSLRGIFEETSTTTTIHTVNISKELVDYIIKELKDD